MKWVTRAGIHIDRAASAWLIARYVDPEASFEYVSGIDEIHDNAIAFDMRGVEFGHHGADCTFETLLCHHDLDDPVLWRIAAIVHEADLEDDRYDAPEAAGFDVVLRGLSMVCADDGVLGITRPVFDGVYEYFKRGFLLDRAPR